MNDIMDRDSSDELAPHRVFTRTEWGHLRADTPLTLSQLEIEDLQGINEPVSMDEFSQIYLPIARLLNLYIAAAQQLFAATQDFLGAREHKVPYVIGLAGSVAAGKSTSARVLRALLAGGPGHPRVDLVPTDGFLLPNAVLTAEGLMDKKGFPESYDVPTLLRFLSDIKAGKRHVKAPVYSHLAYDVLPGRTIEVDQPEVLIVEGLNVLQTGSPPRDGKAIPYVSDFFDFSVYIDADEDVLRRWYVERFFSLRETAFQNPKSYFHRYSRLTDEETFTTANDIWDRINLKNLRENVLPTRHRADLILRKGSDHITEAVALRKL